MAKVFTDEVKTGFVVILCTVILVGLTIMAGSFSLFKKQYKIKAVFTNIAGIQKDATVRLGGVEVGRVINIKLVYTKEGDTKIFVDLELDSNAKLREGVIASITTLGLMGETYIALSHGDVGAPFIEPGSTISGKDPADIDAIIDEAKETMNNISKLAKDLDNAVTGNRGNIDEIMNNLRRSTENFEEFSDDIKRNPWKLLVKGSEDKDKAKDKRGIR